MQEKTRFHETHPPSRAIANNATTKGISRPAVVLTQFALGDWLKKKEQPSQPLEMAARRKEGEERQARNEVAAAEAGTGYGLRVGNIDNAENEYNEVKSNVEEANKSPKGQKASTAISGISGLSSAGGTALNQIASITHLDSIGKWVKGSSAAGSAVGSLVEAGTGIYTLVTEQDQKKDKAIKSINVAGAMANSVHNAASSALTFSELGHNSDILTTGLANTVLAPAAMVKGGTDLVGGLAANRLAVHRSQKLEKLKMKDRGDQNGIIKFAQESQDLKAKTNRNQAISGALTMAGGAALYGLGASNPVGWGVLAAGSLMKIGTKGYNIVKKHQRGNQLLDDQQSQDYGLSADIGSLREIKREGFTDYFKTESMRRYDRVKALIALKLLRQEEDKSDANISDQILETIGVNDGTGGEEKSLLDNEAKKKAERARSIANALDF